jgi:carbonic anhydrase
MPLPRLDADTALQRLREGNVRYASDVRSLESMLSHTRRAALADSQLPFAVILGCSDSRVPAEVVFDQGLGDLFVIRVAGNIVAPSQIGSVEFAAERFGSRLVVVLGHSKCGAIDAAVEVLQSPATERSRNLRSIVDRVLPSVEALAATDAQIDLARLKRAAIRANVMASVEQLRHGSPMLEQLILDEGMRVIGAEYDLETGLVLFHDGSGAGPAP